MISTRSVLVDTPEPAVNVVGSAGSSVARWRGGAVAADRNAGGLDWELRDTGKGEKSMVLEHKGTTIVLTGTAQLDEFAVWSRTLSASEIAQLFNNGNGYDPTA